MMVVGDRHTLLTLTGTGDVLEPTDNVIGMRPLTQSCP